jgi:hypothetical protein
MSDISQQKANEMIAQKVAVVMRLIKECEDLAKLTGVDFSFSVEYGMGGFFDGEEGEWHPSSQSC